MFQFAIPLPVSAVNVRIILGSFDDLIDLKLHSDSWLHKKLGTYLKHRGSIKQNLVDLYDCQKELPLTLDNCCSRAAYGEESVRCRIGETTG